jgi:putative ABC transport system ATP-binding protein
LVGPSGSGKSTLLRLCNRLVMPDAGLVLFHGDPVATLDPLRLRRRVGMVFQRPTPFAGTVRENLQVAEPGLTDAVARHAIARVALEATLLDRDAQQLSGGEAQRVCLARTLVTEPEVVLMDEVTSSVDPSATRGLENLARELAESGASVVWVTHDLEQMGRIADHVVVVIDGRIAHASEAAAVREGAPSAVLRFLDSVAQ